MTFDDLWEIYPRKVAKQHAKKMWERLSDADKFKAIHALPVHVRYWKAAGREYDHIPHCGSWLGGERWEDELQMPQPKTAEDEWWKSQSGIHRKAIAEGIAPRAGEGWHELKARILAKTRAA